MCSLVESPPSCNGSLFTSAETTAYSPLSKSLSDNSSWSTNSRYHHHTPAAIGKQNRDGVEKFLLGANLLLSGEFEDEASKRPVTLYLTNTQLMVATSNGGSNGYTLSGHERSHNLRDIHISQDSNSLIVRNISDDTTFTYKMTQCAPPLDLWLHRISSLEKQATDEVDLSICSLPCNLPVCPSFKVHRPSREWHGEQLTQFTNQFLQTSNSDEFAKNKYSPSPTLKRREAFRGNDMKRFRLSNKIRASSAPPEKNDEEVDGTATSPQSSSSDHLLSPVDHKDNILSDKKNATTTSLSAPSSLRKKKLKFSPRARKFTRALSARIMNTPLISSSSSTHSSPKSRKKEFQRNHSFQSDLLSTASLPRSLPNKYIVRKNHSLSMASSPEPIYPTTPTRLKSPGNFFRLFQRKRIHSVTPQLSTDSNHTDLGEECRSGSTGADTPTVTTTSKDFILNRPSQLKLYCHSPKLIAEELVLLDSELFRKINTSELRDGAWTKKTKQATSPNVLNMIESFNHLARVVCTDIVHERSLHARAKAISTYIQLARACYRLHNYNSMKAIISGLQSQPVYRLTRSWNQVPSRRRKKFEKLSRLCSDLDSTAIQDEMLNNLHSRIQCIPYLGWLLTSVLHYQVYVQLRRTSRTRSASLSGGEYNNKKKWRESACSISMPTSPVQSYDEREEERESCENITRLASGDISPTSLHISKSLTDLSSALNIYSIITQPLEDDFNKETPPLGGCGYVERSPSDLSDDMSSLKADSAIGLDSSMSQASPLRINKREEEEEKENYSLPSTSNHYDSDESEDEEEEENVKISFNETTLSSSSSSTSFLSPSMITLSIQPKRRVTMPHLQAPHPSQLKRTSDMFYDFSFGGVLFSSCSIPHNDEDDDDITTRSDINTDITRRQLDQVARRLFNQKEEEEGRCPLVENNPTSDDNNITPIRRDELILSTSQPSSPNKRQQNESNSLRHSQDVYVLFEQYQVNTLNYLTEYGSHNKIKKLILDSPCLGDNECYASSLEVEPNPQ